MAARSREDQAGLRPAHLAAAADELDPSSFFLLHLREALLRARHCCPKPPRVNRCLRPYGRDEQAPA